MKLTKGLNMRNLNAQLIAPIMKLTGFRFSKEYRHAEGTLTFKGIVYALVNTVKANCLAD